MTAGSDEPQRASVKKLLVAGLIVFLVLVAGVMLLAWMLGDTMLPMEYEGFD